MDIDLDEARTSLTNAWMSYRPTDVECFDKERRAAAELGEKAVTDGKLSAARIRYRADDIKYNQQNNIITIRVAMVDSLGDISKKAPLAVDFLPDYDKLKSSAERTIRPFLARKGLASEKVLAAEVALTTYPMVEDE